ncbi:hypothetical protein MGMO_97c00290 [Methyloglobulus morosus KoM1]|uniref:DUF484 domain-containing protein n=1 Tax=Methyloglobulus morosus KoM1 TaxID=1116472 RepID=V5DW32_9GAMM|nr:DUF484 family protein [Methyloglobulus morosus]ESS71551.1 hypothetical protein MGMO_97c00290 [Methyloglobulus morosus KoM1]
MSDQEKTKLTATQVEQYLRDHPEFFNEHLHLLEQMRIPHPSGNAVSLISKQLELFRSRHQELESQLTELIEIARENDTSYVRMHKLTLALLDAKTIEEAVANLETVLSEYFLTDFVAIRIIKPVPDAPISNLYIEPDSDNLKPFSKELASNQPTCGKPTLTQAKILFGDASLEVQSYAIMPMLFTEMEGFLAVGSREDGRFHYSMGSLFLTQMSEIVGTRLIALISGQ